METEEILQWIMGKWEASFENEGRNEKITVSIANPYYSSNLIWTINDKEIMNTALGQPTIFGGGKFVEFLISGNQKQYYIKAPFNDVLIFGEYDGHVLIQNVKWEKQFNRLPPSSS